MKLFAVISHDWDTEDNPDVAADELWPDVMEGFYLDKAAADHKATSMGTDKSGDYNAHVLPTELVDVDGPPPTEPIFLVYAYEDHGLGPNAWGIGAYLTRTDAERAALDVDMKEVIGCLKSNVDRFGAKSPADDKDVERKRDWFYRDYAWTQRLTAAINELETIRRNLTQDNILDSKRRLMEIETSVREPGRHNPCRSVDECTAAADVCILEGRIVTS